MQCNKQHCRFVQIWKTNKPNTKTSLENVFTEDLNDDTYEEIPEEVYAIDDNLDDEDWLDLQKGNVDMSLIQKLEQAKEEYKHRTHKCDIVEPTTLHTEVVK